MEYAIPSPKEIRKSFQKKEYSFLEYHFYRRISPYFTWIFLHITICAEIIALLTPLADIFTIYLISNGNFIWAAVLTQIHIIFDSSDGEVARFRKKIIKRTKNQEAFGGFVDSIAGFILFPFVIFYSALEFGNLATALISTGIFYILVASSAYTKVYFPKSKIGVNIREKTLGKRKYKWGFNSIVQKSLITLALLFQSIIFIWIFVAGAGAIILIRIFWLYQRSSQ